MTNKLYLVAFFLPLLFFITNTGLGQGLEQIQSEKIAFFTDKMKLTPEEAAVFWPLYNEYQNKKHELNKQKNSVLIYFRRNEQRLSEDELKKLTQRYLSYQREEAQLINTYTNRFMQVLPIEKVLKIYITEAEFRRYLIDQIRKKRVAPKLRDNR